MFGEIPLIKSSRQIKDYYDGHLTDGKNRSSERGDCSRAHGQSPDLESRWLVPSPLPRTCAHVHTCTHTFLPESSPSSLGQPSPADVPVSQALATSGKQDGGWQEGRASIHASEHGHSPGPGKKGLGSALLSSHPIQEEASIYRLAVPSTQGFVRAAGTAPVCLRLKTWCPPCPREGLAQETGGWQPTFHPPLLWTSRGPLDGHVKNCHPTNPPKPP